MLINGDEIYNVIQAYRLVWISGRFGGGKTSLAFYLSKYWLDKGYRLVTNGASVWSDELDNVRLDSENKLHCVFLLDEGGLDFKANRQIEAIASYARKMDCIYLIPSYSEPCRPARVVTIQAVFTLQSIGLPIIFYKWRVLLAEQKTGGMFAWMFPSEVYGVYSTLDPGAECSEIIGWAIERKNEFLKAYGRQRKYGLPEVETQGGQAPSFDDFVVAAEELTGAIDGMQTLPSRKGKK